MKSGGGEDLAVLRTDFVRMKKMMKINECFSYDKVKDFYAEGHGVDYHENDKTKVKNKIKNKMKKKDKDKMIVDEILKQNESSNI